MQPITFDLPGGITLQGRIYDPSPSSALSDQGTVDGPPRALCIIAHVSS